MTDGIEEGSVAWYLEAGIVCYCHDCLIYYKHSIAKCDSCGRPTSDIRVGYDPKPLEKKRRFGLYHPANLPKGQWAEPIEEDK